MRVLLCSVLATAAAAFPARAQLLNGGFETGSLSPWYNGADFCSGGCAAWSVTYADAHTGIYSATNLGNMQLRQDFAPIFGADILSFSFWMRQPEEAISAVGLYYTDGTYSETIVTPGAEWSHFEIGFLAIDWKWVNGFYVFGYSGGASGDDRTYIDDVVVVTAAVPEPGTAILLATGLLVTAGMVVRRRTKTS
jgi:hypothetical protein